MAIEHEMGVHFPETGHDGHRFCGNNGIFRRHRQTVLRSDLGDFVIINKDNRIVDGRAAKSIKQSAADKRVFLCISCGAERNARD